MADRFSVKMRSSIMARIGSKNSSSEKRVRSLMFELIREASLIHELPDACQEDLLTKFYPDLACQALLQLQESGPYDLLVLDETQDLLLPAFVDVLDLLLKGGFKAGRWRAFYDPKQDLYVKD
jgi:hypothetical protein